MRSVTIIGIVLALLIGLYVVMQNQVKGSSITGAAPQVLIYSDLRAKVDAGQVKEIEIHNDEATGILTDGKKFKATLPPLMGSAPLQNALDAKGIKTRVVSVPCFELLMEQPEAARRALIGDAKVKIGVEAAVRQGWDAIIGADGAFIGMSSFGASAPYKDLYKHFGITPEAVAAAAEGALK